MNNYDIFKKKEKYHLLYASYVLCTEFYSLNTYLIKYFVARIIIHIYKWWTWNGRSEMTCSRSHLISGCETSYLHRLSHFHYIIFGE